MKIIRTSDKEYTTLLDNAPSLVLTILNTLNRGSEAYLVGGAVRDLLNGDTPKDWDIATISSLEHVASLFADDPDIYVSDEEGKSFGVCRISNRLDPKFTVEVARYRKDGEYSDYRRPSSVGFVKTIAEDLARRDFTINAMALNSDSFVCGETALEDLEAGVLRAVGTARDRFSEDPVRMLRLFRFLAQGRAETVESETQEAVVRMAHLLQHISEERVMTELTKMLSSPYSFRLTKSLRLMQKCSVLRMILPEVADLVGVTQNPKWHRYDAFEHTLHALQNTPPILVIRLAVLFHDIGKALTRTVKEDGSVHFYGHEESSTTLARTAMQRLRFSNEMITTVTKFVRWHMYPFWLEPTCRKFRRLMAKSGMSAAEVRFLLAIRKADRLGSGKIPEYHVQNQFDIVRGVFFDTLAEQPATAPSMLAVNGHDVIDVAGVTGVDVGKILKSLLAIVVEEPEENNREKLLARLSKYRISGRLV